MKHIFLLAVITLQIVAYAQGPKSGQIKFTETTKFEIKIDGVGSEEMKKLIPPSQVVEKELFFNDNETIFRNVKDNNDVEESSDEEEGNLTQLKINIPQAVYYTNKANNEYVNATNFLGKDFLIKDVIKQEKWKLTGEQKSFLGYNCQKATLIDDKKILTVWFTPQLPTVAGPNALAGLPGMILIAEYDNGQKTIIASEVNLKALDATTIVKPNKGSVVTKAEFNKIRDEKLAEMGAVSGSGGTRMIISTKRN
jgi:GLPGLI family protein